MTDWINEDQRCDVVRKVNAWCVASVGEAPNDPLTGAVNDAFSVKQALEPRQPGQRKLVWSPEYVRSLF